MTFVGFLQYTVKLTKLRIYKEDSPWHQVTRPSVYAMVTRCSSVSSNRNSRQKVFQDFVPVFKVVKETLTYCSFQKRGKRLWNKE